MAGTREPDLYIVRPSASKLLVLLVVLVLGLVAYRETRDTVVLKCVLPPRDVKLIVSELKEWSRPKLFRHIEIEQDHEGRVLASVREPDAHWSVTVFTNQIGVWENCAWFLVKEDKDVTVQSQL